MLHLSPNLSLPVCLRPGHCLLLQSHALLLLEDFVCLSLQVDQHFIFALDLFFLVDDFLSNSVLELDEVLRIPCETLVARALPTHWEVLPAVPRHDPAFVLCMKRLRYREQFLEGNCGLLVKEDSQVFDAAELKQLRLVAQKVSS